MSPAPNLDEVDVYLLREDGVEGPLGPGQLLELWLEAFGWFDEPDEEMP